ncbi:MAG: nucleotidyltransferase domain-containing protein [bacterium]|nr:nucleotidyltransferase domain-containing protein [Microgenomates group bacterium]
MQKRNTRKRSSQVREKILDFLLWRPAEQFYEKEIAQKIDVSKSAVNLIMKLLIKEGWLSLMEKGRLNLYQANLGSVKVRNYKKSITLKKLDKLINYLQDRAERLILFGSAATGEDSMISDLDILIVSSRELRMKKIRKLLPNDRQGQIIIKTADEFRELRSKNKVFYQSIMRGESLI